MKPRFNHQQKNSRGAGRLRGKVRYPSLRQEIYRPRVAKPKLLHVTAPTR